MNYKFIDSKNSLYSQAVALRVNLFFEGISDPSDLIYDVYEKGSIHLVCIESDAVIGTGRLSLFDNEAVISQMAIDEAYQQKGVGQAILDLLIDKCIERKITKIDLSARVTALEFYSKNGFVTIGEHYSSKKTGVIHQDMVRVLEVE